MNGSGETPVAIQVESDIVVARRAVREAARAQGFGMSDTTRIVTAASELARNIFKYAKEGVMYIGAINSNEGTGIALRFVDHGPGIPDIQLALQEGFSTSGGLGLGLPGAKRLMDEMEVRSTPGNGASVIVKKWRR